MDTLTVSEDLIEGRLKIFISWHGPQSRVIAEALFHWLPNVIQNTDPFFSPNIEKGTKGLNEVHKRLEESNFGIICLTPENLASTWIHFEAGALAKLRDNSRVYTLLHNLKPVDIVAPLSQFQHTLLEKEEVFQLIDSINSFARYGADPNKLNAIFDKWWPDLELALREIPIEGQIVASIDDAVQRPQRDMIEEILVNVRRIATDASRNDSGRELDGQDSSGKTESLDNPYIAKTLGNLITAKQIWELRSLERKLNVSANMLCQLRYGCDIHELTKKIADSLIEEFSMTLDKINQ